jgi:hypothetical protein
MEKEYKRKEFKWGDGAFFRKIYPLPRVIIHMYINSIKEMNFTGLADCR